MVVVDSTVGLRLAHRESLGARKPALEVSVSSRSNGESEGIGRPPHSGLCQCCVHDRECVYPRADDQPVRFCDEFTPPGSRPPRYPLRNDQDGDSTGRVESVENAEGRLLGLCRMCIHQAECQFPKPEGGVWHCGEFE